MIERYSRPTLRNVWSEEAKYRTWLDVEILACEALANLGKIPPDALTEIKTKAAVDVAKILAREEETRHDVAAFVSVVQEAIGAAGRYVHLGLTSSDVVDTAFSYRLKRSGELILKELDSVLSVLKKNAERDRDLVMMGRTHGIHAEPITMGLKWLSWYAMFRRTRRRVAEGVAEVAVGKLSGAVGTYAHLSPDVERFVCEKLGLKVDEISTQVIARDRHAAFFSALALLGSAVETVAVELRHLQRTEVGEVREGFGKKQKGSSAMPHKRNPISAENLTGLARLLRGMVVPALENCALWHERDISHSSVERVIGPDATILADYMLARFGKLIEQLEVFPERMRKNADLLKGVIFSQRVLLALAEQGMSRDEAYEIVQRHALTALDGGPSFQELLEKDQKVLSKMGPNALKKVFSLEGYLHHLDTIYRRVFDAD